MLKRFTRFGWLLVPLLPWIGSEIYYALRIRSKGVLTARQGRHATRIMSSHALLPILLSVTTTGCIYFPTPHKEWVTPPASGRVMAAGTRLPITNAVITRYGPAVVHYETRSDSGGHFSVPGVRELRWLHLDRAAYGNVRVEATGYAPAGLSRGGWAFAKDLHLDFGEVLLTPR